jgi:type IV secretory pathway VirJ component
MAQPTEGQQIELEFQKIELDKQRIQNDREIELKKIEIEVKRLETEARSRDREIELKVEELKIQGQDLQERRRFFRSPIIIGILMTFLGFVVSATLEWFKAEKSLKSNLILQTIKTGNSAEAVRNLQFLVEAGLIKDDDGTLARASTISKVAVLPAASPTSSSQERRLGFQTEVVSTLQQAIEGFDVAGLDTLRLGELTPEARNDLRMLTLRQFRRLLDDEFYDQRSNWTVRDLVRYLSLNIEPTEP